MNATPPIRIENNRFVLTESGRPFVPMGFNVVRLDLRGEGGHATFSPFVYNRERTRTALNHMASAGFNVVRVFINGSRGRRGTLVESPDADGLSTAYLDNLADFLIQARNHSIYVIPCFEVFPENGPYARFLTVELENVSGWNRHYLHPGYIEAKKAYLEDIIQALQQRHPEALQAVFCWDIMNELCYALGDAPFSLDQGTVTPANGITYDLATEKTKLADDMAAYYINTISASILKRVPQALINANVFTYHAVGRTGAGDFHQDEAAWKNRYPFRPLALLASQATVIDIHFYSPDPDALERDLASIAFDPLRSSLRNHPGKALLTGEFGAFRGVHPDLEVAAAWMGTMATRLIDLGFAGWLHWTYDTDEQARLWNASSGGGAIFAALARAMQPGRAAEVSMDDAAEAPFPLNTMVGTQTIGIKYHFTEETGLVETAQRILDMGSNILKISMTQGYCKADYSLPERDDIHSLTDLAQREPSFARVLGMPFATYHIWTYTFAVGTGWGDGVTQTEREREYREVYDFACYLLTTYAHTGKTFLLGHWEGDWHLLQGYERDKAPSPVTVTGMIDWLTTRQHAIDDAKRDTAATGVRLFHYTELNLMQKALKGESCLVNDVLPHTAVDYVSYSSYDTVNPNMGHARDALFEALDFIESKLPPKDGIEGKRVFIGEFGFPTANSITPALQDAHSRDVCLAALEWGCPYVLYWEMYCNEISEGKHRGFWLIDDQNREQPFYKTLKATYAALATFTAKFERDHGAPPSPSDLRAEALRVLRRDTP